MNTAHLQVGPEVARARVAGEPLVALETAVLTHGLPAEVAWSTYDSMLTAVREGGAVPAAVGMRHGVLWVGLPSEALIGLSRDPAARKLGLAELPAAAAAGASGGTTVAATLWACRQSGVAVFATGGIGGVHRGAAESFDISGDLAALSRFGGCVVCSGAKAILDLGKTLEALQSLGVCVIGYRTGTFPAFVTADSGLALGERVEDPEAAAAVVRARDALGLPGAVLLANPPPAATAVPRRELDTALASALTRAGGAGVSGSAVTPFLLGELATHSGGRSLNANRELLVANCELAAQVAVSLARQPARS
ncbi:MAG: pseudouridine-5'-phosphate glycosidase [Deferrisomatales bacterium]|nr:pseudouridine-5'-phosphate glycosidase [Deferrisomatales bacterium]